MDRENLEEMIKKMLGKPMNNISHPSSYASGATANGFGEMNNEHLLREQLSSYLLQQMQQKQEQPAPTNAPEPSTTQSAKNGGTDVKVDLTLPDIESLMKVLIQNVKRSNQDQSALEEEKYKRLALEKEAEEMRQKIKMFETMSQKTEAAEAQQKLDAFEAFNAMKNRKPSEDSMQARLAKYIGEMMLNESPAKKKVLNDPKWFPGTSKNPEHSNMNSEQHKPMFKDMLKNPLNADMPQQAHNFMQPGPSEQFHGGPNNYPQPPHHVNLPPYQQNGYPPMQGPYPWPGHGSAPGMFPQQPPHMMGYSGAPGAHGNMWQFEGPHLGYQGPRGPYPPQNLKQPMPPQQEKKKLKQPQQQQNQTKQKQQQQNQQNQSKPKQPQLNQQNQPKQKQPQQSQPQQNQPKQNQPPQNQPKQKQQNQNQAPKNIPPTQEMSKKKKNSQNQEQNGAQSKLTVPVGSCFTLSPNSSSSAPSAAQNENSTGIKLTQEEINELKQSIKTMNENATPAGRKRNKKKKTVEGAANNDEEDDSGSGGEGKNNLGSGGMVKNELGEGAKKKANVNKQKQLTETPHVVLPGEGKKKKKKKNGGVDGSQPNSEFSLFVGDRWPTLADIEAGRLKLDQPVKNILMVAKTPKGDICSTPKIIQDMLIFNKLHTNAVLVFSSD